ncbi:MAG: hypothetical protein ACE5JX_10795 [Acidobacteriota bacterium]
MTFSPIRTRWCIVLSCFCLISASRLQAESVLNFPRLSNQVDTITGVAFVNPTAENAPVTITAYGSQGTILQGKGIVNPVELTLPANGQVGKLTAEIFGTGLDDSVVGWFQATSPVDGITGFFLFLNHSMSLFDGADLPPVDRKIAFNQIRVDNGYTTELNIVNTGDQVTHLDLLLIDDSDVRVRVLENLAPMGVARLDVAGFFNLDQISEGAYVLVTPSLEPDLVVLDDRIAGFEFVRSPNGDLLGLNARSAGEQLNTLYIPQLAVQGDPSFTMEIGTVNYAPEPVSLIITAFKPEGFPYLPGEEVERNPVFRNLGAGLSLREDVQTMFGFLGSQVREGWVKIEADNEAVNGYVTYGVPTAGSVAAVAAVPQGQTRAIFSHIATTLGFFTGLAALNPAALAANLRLVALTASGKILGSFDTVLQPGQRISRLLRDLIPEADGQAGGIIWAKSDRPLYLTSLFGTDTSTVLANIPPQPAPPGYLPDAGLASLRINPQLSVLAPGQSENFSESSATPNLIWSVNGEPGGNATVGTVDGSGSYQAPSLQPPSLPILVTAADGDLEAGATVDVLDRQSLIHWLPEVGPIAYLKGLGRLYAVQKGDGSSTILEVETSSSRELATFSEEITAAIPFESFDGQEFLLLAGRQGGRVIRFDPVSLSGDSREVVTGLNQPVALAPDPVTGNLLVADGEGVTLVSRVQLESDLVSGLDQNGSPPVQLFQASGNRGVAVDACTGKIYFSSGTAGEIREFDPVTEQVRNVVSGLDSPESLLPLYRRDAACPSSFHLLVTEPGSNRVSLILPAEGVTMTWSSIESPISLAFLDDGGPFSDTPLVAIAASGGDEGLQTALGLSTASRLSGVDTSELYQPDAINPLLAVPVGTVSDPVGDIYGIESIQHDIVEMVIRATETSVLVSVTFADPVSPCLEPCLPDGTQPVDAVGGLIDVDVDQDPSTGLVASVDLNSPYTSGLGIDFCIDLFSYNPDKGGAEAFQVVGGEFFSAGRLPVQFGTHSMSVSIPRSLLDSAGKVNAALVVGTASGPTDAVPNGGFMMMGGGGVSASGRVVAAAAETDSDSGSRLRTRVANWKRMISPQGGGADRMR